MSEWQPIETAPKDGTAVLIFAPATSELDAVIQVAHFTRNGYPSVNRWVEFHGEGYETYEPTHWMALPSPP